MRHLGEVPHRYKRMRPLPYPDGDSMGGVSKEDRERLLEGKVAIVTGSRDIGGGIITALTAAGATVIATHREQPAEGKGAKFREMQKIRNAAGDRGHFLQANITDPTGREAIDAKVEELGGQVDFLILNASGKGREVNVEANGALLDMFIPKVREGGRVVLMQSDPGHFYPALEGSVMPQDYRDVAPAKFEGEDEFRKRIPDMVARSITPLVICPPAVPDTSNVKMFDWHARNNGEVPLTQVHNRISDQLGLPRTVSIKDVGDKVLDLLTRPDVAPGHTELFGDVRDSFTRFRNLYGDNRIYVHTFEEKGEVNGEKRGRGRMIISKSQAEHEGEAPMVDKAIMDPENPFHMTGEVTITDQARGHFRQSEGDVKPGEFRLPETLQGHKQVLMGSEVLKSAIRNAGYPSADVRITGWDSVDFSGVVPPSSVLKSDINVTAMQDARATIQVINTVGEKVVSTVKDMNVEVKLDGPFVKEGVIDATQVLESAVQVTGEAAGVMGVEGQMPLFGGVGKAQFYYDAPLVAGEGLVVDVGVNNVAKKKITAGAIITTSNGIPVADIEGLQARVVESKTLTRGSKMSTVSKLA